MNKIRKGDTVQVMRGKDAGKRGEVEAVLETDMGKKGIKMQVVVHGINIVKRSQKPNPQLGIKGGIIELEKPIDISNVMFVDKKKDVPTRVGFKVDEKTGRRVRVSKKTGEVID